MEKKYTCILRNVYWEPKKNIMTNGRSIEFINGIANGVPEYVAKRLLHLKVLKEIIPENDDDGVVEYLHVEDSPTSIQEPQPVVVLEEQDAPEVQAFEDEDQDEVVESPQSLPVEPVANVEETQDGLLTAEEISSMYERLGTWSAVAAELNITTSVLRRYRDNLGL